MSVQALLVRIMASVAPATVIVGIFPLALAVTGLIALPAAMITATAVLLLWTPGYVAMARHIPHTGAFYPYVAAGLGRPLGVAAAWFAAMAYFGFLVGSAGGVGGFGAPLLTALTGVPIPWLLLALPAWALTYYLGLREARVSGRFLVVLLLVETAFVIVVDALIVARSDFHFNLAALDVRGLLSPGGGALMGIVFTGFAGGEQAVAWLSQARHGVRTVRSATVLGFLLIGAFYGISAWIMVSSGGPGIIAQATDQNAAATLYYDQVGPEHSGPVAAIGAVLLVSSTYAAWLAFGPVLDRYLHALGAEGVLPRWIGQLSGAVPRNAAHARSWATLAAFLIAAALQTDPVKLFYVFGTTGGVGVLLLIALTALAICVFFMRGTRGVPVMQSLVAPILAAAALLVISYFAVRHLEVLYGDPVAARVIPLIVAVIAGLGLLWALVLRVTAPDTYHQIGRGQPTAVLTSDTTAGPRHAAGFDTDMRPPLSGDRR